MNSNYTEFRELLNSCEFYKQSFESEKQYTEKLREDIIKLKQLITNLSRKNDTVIGLPEIHVTPSLVGDGDIASKSFNKINLDRKIKANTILCNSQIPNREVHKFSYPSFHDASTINHRESIVNRSNKLHTPFRKTLMNCDYEARVRGNRQAMQARNCHALTGKLPPISRPSKTKKIEHIVTMAKGSNKPIGYSKSK